MAEAIIGAQMRAHNPELCSSLAASSGGGAVLTKPVLLMPALRTTASPSLHPSVPTLASMPVSVWSSTMSRNPVPRGGMASTPCSAARRGGPVIGLARS